jgi:hypothetical protein
LKDIRSLVDYVCVVDIVSLCPPSPVHFITETKGEYEGVTPVLEAMCEYSYTELRKRR